MNIILSHHIAISKTIFKSTFCFLFYLFSLSLHSQITIPVAEKKTIHIEKKQTRQFITSDSLAIERKSNVINSTIENDAYENKYKHISTYVPQKEDAVKIVNINFNIFQDYYGNNNFSPFTEKSDSVRLINMLSWVNEIFANQPRCSGSHTYNSDPPKGVNIEDLDHKYIQFTLKGIYIYKDKYEGEDLWKSNNAKLLLERIASVDSSRLIQLNICFTEKHFLGSVRKIEINDGGSNYSHPMILINGDGNGARAFAIVSEGSISNIFLADGGKGFTTEPKIDIIGGEGVNAKATAVIDKSSGKISQINIINPGKGYKHTSIIINGGGGRGSTAYVEKISNGKISKIYVANQGRSYTEEPEVLVLSDSRGYGAELSAIVKGATGFTTTPSLINTDLYVVEKSLWKNGNPKGDYAAATNIAHELGHTLGLFHTYAGGSETNNTQHHDYLWDVFGLPFSGYHNVEWGKDPCYSASDLITNNLMGGNQISQYTSPLQIGKMHRALHLYNVKKYSECLCDTNKFWQINDNEIWNFDIKLYSQLKVNSNNTLIINGTLEMPDDCNIIIEAGATLIIGENGIITGGCNNYWDGKLIIHKKGSFEILDGGKKINKKQPK